MSHFYVFFSGLPKSYPQQAIRDLFSRCGNVVSLRISAPKGEQRSSSSAAAVSVSDSLTQAGLIEYADEASQQAAIALFNGYVIDTPRGSVRIRVGASSGYGSSSSAAAAGRIRGRGGDASHQSSGPGSGIENNAGTYKHEKFIDSDLSTSEHLITIFEEKQLRQQQHQQQGLFGSSSSASHSSSTSAPPAPHIRRSTFDPLQASLLRAPEHELSEAVEQLRVLCAEQPDRARMLLETFPQLRRAVCMILQKEEKLPIPLPPEAFIERHENNNSINASSSSKQGGGSLQEEEAAKASKNADGGDSGAIVDPEEQEQIQNIINELSPEALAEMLSADFESQEGQMEEPIRQHFMKIQRQLRAMTEE